MNIEPATPTTTGSPDRFIGDVWVDWIAAPHESDQRMSVAIVRFAPGARTAWHSHERGQYLRVTQGIARFGTRDGQVIEVHPGQTIYTPPGQEHWHAAAADGFMEHLAMLESGDDPATTTTWNEHVTDEDMGDRVHTSSGHGAVVSCGEGREALPQCRASGRVDEAGPSGGVADERDEVAAEGDVVRVDDAEHGGSIDRSA